MDRQKDIKVLVVDDSPVSRELLIHILESDPDLHVIHTIKSGRDALTWLKTHKPDVITMDIVMPGMDGFETTRQIMESTPLPIAIISATFSDKDTEKAFRSMQAGALAILPKPVGPEHPRYQKEADEIIKTLKTIADVKVVKRRTIPLFNPNIPNEEETPLTPQKDIEAIAIGASLGGPVAIAHILAPLDPSFPIPIFIVQHIAQGFTSGFINWLSQNSKLHFKLAEDGEKPLPGYAYVAPDKCHMEVKRNRIMLDFAPTDGIQPSVSRLFKSMAHNFGQKAAGILLTGMGKDGARELLLMKQKGAYTIAQSEEGCLMFSMPKEAINIGGATSVLNLNQIANLLNLWNKSN